MLTNVLLTPYKTSFKCYIYHRHHHQHSISNCGWSKDVAQFHHVEESEQSNTYNDSYVPRCSERIETDLLTFRRHITTQYEQYAGIAKKRNSSGACSSKASEENGIVVLTFATTWFAVRGFCITTRAFWSNTASVTSVVIWISAHAGFSRHFKCFKCQFSRLIWVISLSLYPRPD